MRSKQAAPTFRAAVRQVRPVQSNVMAVSRTLALPRLALGDHLAPASVALATTWNRRTGYPMTGGPSRVNSPDTRAALMAAAQGGDRSAYDALLRDCIAPIKSAARRVGVPADRIDDVVQDVLLTIHR